MTTTTVPDTPPSDRTPTDRLVVTHIGGPTALVEYGGIRIITDPTFDPPGPHPIADGRQLLKLTGPAVGRPELGRVDLVLLSHDQHPDNLDDAGRDLLDEVSLVLSTPAAAERIPGLRGLQPWETVQVPAPEAGGLTVTAVPALHGPVGAEEFSGPVTGFVLQAKDLPTVYVSGDNASVELVTEIGARFDRIDVAVLFAGAARRPDVDDQLTLTAADAVLAARALGEPLVVPVHADGWLHFTESVGTVAGAFHRAGLGHLLRLPLAGVPLPL